MLSENNGKLAVWCQHKSDLSRLQLLAESLAVPLYDSVTKKNSETFFLTYRDSCLKLLDKELLKKGGLSVDIQPRAGEQHSYPAPKQGDLAKALGRKTKIIVDATTGWGQDALFMFRMGYQVECIERSKLMAILLEDGFQRLSQLDWMQSRQLKSPSIAQGNAIELLANLKIAPDCIYLDPMFPPKRKKSALAKKSMQILQELLGQDEDKEQLFVAAFNATAKRVVVKTPDYAESLGGKPDESFKGKLLRYDVYLKRKS